MTDSFENSAQPDSAENSEFFSFNAPLPAGHDSYLRRAADTELLKHILAGHYVHVLAPARSGKTSLLANAAAELQMKDCIVATIDLAQIGARGGSADAGRWYYTIAYRVLRQLRIKFDLQAWWHDRAILSNRQRLFEFYVEVILRKTSKQVVIFVDEAQCVTELPFAAHFLASVRAAFDARLTDREFERLSFVLLGNGDLELFSADYAASPFVVGHAVSLEDFSRSEIEPYGKQLDLPPDQEQPALNRIYYWTSGQPYLLQKLVRLVSREQVEGNIDAGIDRIVRVHLAGRVALHNEPHLISIQRYLTQLGKESEPILNLYGQIAKGIEIVFDAGSLPQRRLLSSGLVTVSVSGELRPRNRIYRDVFTAKWANQHLPLHIRRLVIAAAILFVTLLLPIWYTQFLPRAYIDDLSSSARDLDAGWAAYNGLKSFPGHATAAERLYRNYLDNQALASNSEFEILAVSGFANRFTGSNELADQMLSAYWDRQAISEMANENRDPALRAALKALGVATPQRRRLAAALVGNDYPRLVKSYLPPNSFERLSLDGQTAIVSYVTGSTVRQVQFAGSDMQLREPWTITAMDVQPLVRRVEIDNDGRTNRLGLSINVSHSRVDDLRLKLIAPSGRTVELDFNVSSSSANDVVRFEPRELADLRGEVLRGTWSLSVRDEKLGVTGQLLAWHLTLNSQVIVEEFERGMDIGDPQALDSDWMWLDPAGRYAVARVGRNENVRVWDLTSAQVIGAVSIPLNESIVGLADNGAMLATASQDAVHLWNTRNGKSSGLLAVGSGSPDSLLVAGGRNLMALTTTEQDVHLDLWSLQTRKKLDSFEVAGMPALIAVNARGDRVAIADYDRAVRVRAIPGGEYLAQFSLKKQPSAMRFAANGDVLGVLHAGDGLSVWNISNQAQPVFAEWGADLWNIEFTPSGDRFIAGGSAAGYRVYRSVDGQSSGPNLDTTSDRSGIDRLGFTEDEQMLVTVGGNGLARFWDAKSSLAVGPAQAATTNRPGGLLGGQSVLALSPDGTRIAITDSAGHVHIQALDASEALVPTVDELSFIGHRGVITQLVFSRDSKLIASTGRDGMVRIWDVESGLPRPFLAKGPAGEIQAIELSFSGQRLAVISGSRIWVMDTADGQILAELELGELQPAAVFASDSQLYVGSTSGVLSLIEVDGAGHWHARTVWQGTAGIRLLDFAPRNGRLAIADAVNQVRLLHTSDGKIDSSIQQLPSTIFDLKFSPGETRLITRTRRWLHRATVSANGLISSDVIPTASLPADARITFGVPYSDESPMQSRVTSAKDPHGNRVLLANRGGGGQLVARYYFDLSESPTLSGDAHVLGASWMNRLQ